MDKKLRKDILETLKEHDKVVYLSGVTNKLVAEHGHEEGGVGRHQRHG